MSTDAALPPSKPARRGGAAGDFKPVAGTPPVEWIITEGLQDYDAAIGIMEDRVARIAAGDKPECVWLVEHPALYTAGTSARDEDLVAADFPVYRTGRGGQYTYHGPGQRVVYVMLDLQRRNPDVRAFVAALEDWAIATLAAFMLSADRRQDRVGVWVARPDKAPGLDGTPAEDKIAAIGIRIRRWVSYHGMSINVEPDLGHFSGIVPCGIAARHFGVTSLVDLGRPVTMAEVDSVLRATFEPIFGTTVAAADRELQDRWRSMPDVGRS